MIQTQAFISSVEQNPLFGTLLKPAWDQFIESLKTAPLAQEVVEILNTGNLNFLVSGVKDISAFSSKLKQYVECDPELGVEDKARKKALASVIGGKEKEGFEIAKLADKSINRLKNQQTILLALFEN